MIPLGILDIFIAVLQYHEIAALQTGMSMSPLTMACILVCESNRPNDTNIGQEPQQRQWTATTYVDGLDHELHTHLLTVGLVQIEISAAPPQALGAMAAALIDAGRLGAGTSDKARRPNRNHGLPADSTRRTSLILAEVPSATTESRTRRTCLIF